MPNSSAIGASRRRFLLVVGLGLTAPLLPSGCSRAPQARTDWSELAGALSGLDGATIESIGTALHDKRSARLSSLVDELPPVPDAQWVHEGLAHAPGTDPIPALSREIRGQYLRMNTDTIDGWVLSRIELVLIALASGVPE